MNWHFYPLFPEDNTMLDQQEKHRYQRQLDLSQVGEKGQEKLKQAKVLVVGAGGLGCPALLYLSAAGVGTIGIIDPDKVELSNLHRQVLYTSQDVSKEKATVAKEKLLAINPHIQMNAYPEPFSSQNSLDLCKEYDIIIDGTDNFQAKYLINDATLITKKPMVFASVYKFEGQLSVFNYREGPSYRCIFPEHHRLDPNSCVDTGVLGVLPGLLGTMQATETIKIILEIGKVLSGKMKIFNALTLEEQEVEFERNENEIQRVIQAGIQPSPDPTENILDGVTYVDIRETHELPKVDQENILCIPMSKLTKRWKEIPRNQEVIVFCQTGKRSRDAVNYLKDTHQFHNIHSLEGGVHNLKLIK